MYTAASHQTRRALRLRASFHPLGLPVSSSGFVDHGLEMPVFLLQKLGGAVKFSNVAIVQNQDTVAVHDGIQSVLGCREEHK